jgi:predicted ATPase
MAIRACKVVALEGTHGSGKTALAYALTAAYKVDHVKAACLVERARTSPFVELAVVHGVEQLGIDGELHLFAIQIADEQLYARNHEVLFCDRSIASVVGYARLLLGSQTEHVALLNAMRDFCRSYKSVYDAVFFLRDNYPLELTGDRYRPPDIEYQRATERSIHAVCNDVGMRIQDVPVGMSLEQKVAWVRAQLDPMLLPDT